MVKLALSHEDQKAWMAQWKLAAIDLRRIHIEELQALTEEETANLAMYAFPDPDPGYFPLRLGPENSGLVEQQRWFALWPKSL